MLQEELLQIREAMKVTRYRHLSDALDAMVIKDDTNLDNLIEVILENTVVTMGAVAGTLWYYDRHGDGNIHVKAAYGGLEISDISLKPGEGVAGTVIATGDSIMISECQKDSRWAGKVDKKTGFRTESMICCPVFVEKDIFGCIQIINKEENEFFDKKDLKYAKVLMESISNKLSNCPKELLKQYNFYHSDWDEKTTFADIFHHDNGMTMRAIMRGMDEVQKLNSVERETLFFHAEKIRKILNKNSNTVNKGIKRNAMKKNKK